MFTQGVKNDIYDSQVICFPNSIANNVFLAVLDVVAEIAFVRDYEICLVKTHSPRCTVRWQ